MLTASSVVNVITAPAAGAKVSAVSRVVTGSVTAGTVVPSVAPCFGACFFAVEPEHAARGTLTRIDARNIKCVERQLM
jgi:hypothetical protein